MVTTPPGCTCKFCLLHAKKREKIRDSPMNMISYESKIDDAGQPVGQTEEYHGSAELEKIFW